jgi:DNA-binding MarR family transcriptional regulator
MALADFLGSTSEIRIIDFLAENMDMAYNQTEIGKCLKMSRTVINQKIPALIYNNIIEVKECKGNTKRYGLKRNNLVSELVSAIYDHSFMMAECEEEEEEALSRISKECQTFYEEEVECYCGKSHHIKFHSEPTSKIEYNNVENKWGCEQTAQASA